MYWPHNTGTSEEQADAGREGAALHQGSYFPNGGAQSFFAPRPTIWNNVVPAVQFVALNRQKLPPHQNTPQARFNSLIDRQLTNVVTALQRMRGSKHTGTPEWHGRTAKPNIRPGLGVTLLAPVGSIGE